jgi:Concanavalin A-like lectin/glucanases superfamily
VTVRDVYATHIRDDVIENDGMKNVVVEDSLFDGVFVGFSAVSPKTSSKPGNVDPVVTIRDTLVRMENMAGDPTSSTTDHGWGHGRLFKWWDGRSPELVLENNIFVVEDRDAWDDAVNKKIVHASNNIMIWMGEGEFRGKLPAGFKLIEGDDKAFQQARDAWLQRHGYDPNGSLKDNLHAPVLDGAKPAPEPQPTPAPDGGLVATWMLDVDLSGKKQKVVIDHDPSLELDQGTVALTFTADQVSRKQALFSKDSIGFDDGGHLSIWLNKGGQVVARLQSESKSYHLKSDPGAIKAGEASQVAVSFGDQGFRLYVDADLVAQRKYTGGLAQNSKPVVLGANAEGSSDGGANNLKDFFKGTISELAVYDEQFNGNWEITADHHFLARTGPRRHWDRDAIKCSIAYPRAVVAVDDSDLHRRQPGPGPLRGLCDDRSG